MTPIRPFSSTITSFTTADQQGNNKSSFMPGDTVFLRVAVSGSGQQSISNTLVSVMIQDANLTPVFIDYEYCDIQIGGQVTIYFNFQLSSDCTLGDYVAKVNIFTMLPSEGGEPIVGGHAEVYFAVT
jgi:hypothetical protein